MLFLRNKPKALIYAIFLILILLAPQQSQAQFWKKIFEKENTNKKRKSTNSKDTEKKTAEKTQEITEQKQKKIIPEYPFTVRKERYRIDIFLPLYLSNLVQNGKAVNKTKIAPYRAYLNFYEGILLAVEKIKSKEIPLDIYIHDTEDDNFSIQHLEQEKQLQKSDLMIGWVSSAYVPFLANYATQQNINFISALSPSDAQVANNPFFILIQPRLSTHIDRICSYVYKYKNDLPKLIIHRQDEREEEIVNQIKEYFKKEQELAIYNIADKEPDIEKLKHFLVPNHNNLIFVPILESNYARKILDIAKQLPQEYNLEIFGMPSWQSINEIEKTNDNVNLTIYYSSPFAYDEQESDIIMLQAEYQRKYEGNITELVFRGYETIYWTAELLHQFGTVFNSKINNAQKNLFTPYQIEHSWDKNNDYLYMENKFLYLLQFQNGQKKIITSN